MVDDVVRAPWSKWLSGSSCRSDRRSASHGCSRDMWSLKELIGGSCVVAAGPMFGGSKLKVVEDSWSTGIRSRVIGCGVA